MNYDDYEEKINNNAIKNNHINKFKQNKWIILGIIFIIILLIVMFLLIKRIPINKKEENISDNSEVVFEVFKKNITITIGESRKLTDNSDNSLSINSSNNDIVSVSDNGYIYGLSLGHAEIVITRKNQVVAVYQIDVKETDVDLVGISASCKLKVSNEGIVMATIEGDAISYGFNREDVEKRISKDLSINVTEDIYNQLQSDYAGLYKKTEENKNLKDYEKFYYENPIKIKSSVLVTYYVMGADRKISSCNISVGGNFQCTKYGERDTFAKVNDVKYVSLPNEKVTVGCYTEISDVKDTWVRETADTSSKACHDTCTKIGFWSKTCNYNGVVHNPIACGGEDSCCLNITYTNLCANSEGYFIWRRGISLPGPKTQCYKMNKSVNEVYKETGILTGYHITSYSSTNGTKVQFTYQNNFSPFGFSVAGTEEEGK